MRSLTRCSTIKTRWGTHQSLFAVSPDPVWSVRTRVKSKPTEYFPVTISCDVYSLSAGRQRRRRQRRVNKVDTWIIQDQRRSSLRPPRLFCLETTPAAGLKGTFEDETIKKKTVTKKKKKREARLWMHKPLQSVLLPQAETGDRRRCRLVWSLLPFLMKHKCLETLRWLCATNTSPHCGLGAKDGGHRVDLAGSSTRQGWIHKPRWNDNELILINEERFRCTLIIAMDAKGIKDW